MPTDVTPTAEDLALLVVADNAVPDALELPFRNATVVAADSLPLDATGSGPYDAAAIDLQGLDLGRLDQLAAALRARLAPDGDILVALGGPADAVPTEVPETPALDRLAWRGLTSAGGRPYAVLGLTATDTTANSSGVLLTAAHAAASIAAADRLTTQEARQLLAAGERDRRRSEQDLLDQITKLATRVDELSAQLCNEGKGPSPSPATLKAVLRGSPTGRRILRVLGRGKRALGKARRIGRPSG